MRDLDVLFNPRAIAVVGASRDPGKVGTIVVQNLKDSGFTGPIYPINPRAKTICGLPCYTSLTAIPNPIDQVTICVPAARVLEVVEECVTTKVKSIIIISAGFGETSKNNKKLEDKISQLCKENNIILIGPNVIGVMHPESHLNNSWMQRPAPAGNIAFLSQSGALCCSVLDVADQYQLGFSHFCSIGNKADIDELDLVEYFMRADDVKVIACYLEDIRRGYQFIKFLREHIEKPIIIFHSGKTSRAATAAASHTGSMTSDRDLVRTAFFQANVLEAETIHEFCLLLQAFSHLGPVKFPEFGHYGIVTNAGGAGIIVTDEIVSLDWDLATISPPTKKALKAVLPAASSLANPIDILGDAGADRYAQVLDIIGQDPSVEIILNILTPQHVTQPLETAQAIINFSRQHPEKIILNTFLGGDSVEPARRLLATNGLMVFADLRDSVRIGNFLTQRGRNLYDWHERIIKRNYRLTECEPGKYHALLDALLTGRPGQIQILSDHLTSALLREFNVELPAQKVTTKLKEALEFGEQYFPVILKAPNQIFTHKTDHNAVIANIADSQQLAEAFTALQAQIWSQTGDTSHPPVLLLQEMVTGVKLEYFIGAKRDGHSDVYQGGHPGFGHLISFGQGGIYTQLQRDDLGRVLIPERRRDIKEVMWETKLWPLIEGFRGQPALPDSKIMDVIVALQKMLFAYPEITALDINPLLVTSKKVYAVDVKVFIER